MSEPLWLRIAREDLGTAEVPGAATSPKIRRWLLSLGAWWRDDETPWCGVAVGAWMQAAGIQPPREWYRARAWASWGLELGAPQLGAVVVYERKGGGHVGLVVGRSSLGHIMTLGGNQGDRVSIAAFEPHRVLAYRWPLEARDQLSLSTLPLLASVGPVSVRES